MPKSADRSRATARPGRTAADGSKLAEVIAAEIESDIMARHWPIGLVIGSEHDLLEKYGVSRAVFREAVRLLEHHQSATMRRGPGGGLVVMRPDPSAVSASAAMFLDSRDVTPTQLLEMRRAVELSAVELATQRLTEEGVERLRRCLQDEVDALDGAHEEYLNDRLHLEIAELTGNPVYPLFVSVLTRLALERSRLFSALGLREQESHGPHEKLVEAIVAGDAALARHRMSVHLDAITEFFKSFDERSNDGRRPTRKASRGARDGVSGR